MFFDCRNRILICGFAGFAKLMPFILNNFYALLKLNGNYILQSIKIFIFCIMHFLCDLFCDNFRISMGHYVRSVFTEMVTLDYMTMVPWKPGKESHICFTTLFTITAQVTQQRQKAKIFFTVSQVFWF